MKTNSRPCTSLLAFVWQTALAPHSLPILGINDMCSALVAPMPDWLTQVLSGVPIAVLSSWIAVKLSLRQFQAQRWWEKKVEAYERVIETFHQARLFSSEHLRSIQHGGEVDAKRDAELRRHSREAKDEIERASSIGRFLLSTEAMRLLAECNDELDKASKLTDWDDYLAAEHSITGKYMDAFIAEAGEDLRK